MFLKMLKSDLKQKKGLSAVLFLFITAASVLVFVSGVQIYQFFTVSERNSTACKSSDMIVYNPIISGSENNYEKELENALDNDTNVAGFYKKEIRQISDGCFYFPYVDESEVDQLKYGSYYLMTINKEGDLLYTLDDKPFAVENGTVWVSEKMRSMAYAEVGQTVRLTTDLGNTYELVIAGFYKQPYSSYNKWYIVSDGDYELLSGEIFNKSDMYGVKFKTMDIASYIVLNDKITKSTLADTDLQNPESSDDYILGYIIAIFISLISIFLILIVVMTIRFTMIATLKDEEREIGMLRAIGADSIKFRWLFAAKYIFFAFTGGIIGIIAGLPVSKTVFLTFSPGNIMPSIGEMIIIGVCSVVFIMALIIFFSFLVMRHINKISVVAAIRGENSAEHFGSTKGLLLHKRKKMIPSFYFACADLTKRFKRYIFLFIAYTLGVLIILFAVNIKNSVITPDFLKYSLNYQMDFSLEFTNEKFIEYIDEMQKTNKELWDIVNEEIKEAGIPAHIDADHYQALGRLRHNDSEYSSVIWWGSGDISKLSYHAGSIPVHKDEVALSWSAANSLGISLGDEVEFTIPYVTVKNDKSESEYTETKTKCKVTGFINAMDSGVPIALIGSEFEIPSHGKTYMAMIIDSDDKDIVLAQLSEHFGAESVRSGMEYTRSILVTYSTIFDILEYAVGAAVLLILALMTYLYSSVFIAEKTTEAALMKSIGFRESTIKAAHIFRMLILVLVSVILGEILLRTLGQFIVGIIMESLGITGFGLLPEFFLSFIVIPVLITATVLITQWLTLRRIDNIDILSIRDE